MLYYGAGAETLFSVHALRSFQEQHAVASLEKALADIASTRPDIILRSLPRLLQSYGQAQTKHRASLYGQGSKQNSGSTTEQARSATIEFFAMCEALLSQIPENADVWKTRDSLLLVVEDEGFLSRIDQASTALLRRMAETAITSLASLPQGDIHDFTFAYTLCLPFRSRCRSIQKHGSYPCNPNNTDAHRLRCGFVWLASRSAYPDHGAIIHLICP